MSLDVVAILKQTDLFRGLDDEELGILAGLCEELEYPAGAEIFAEGSAGTELFVVPEGRVSVDIRIDGQHEQETIHKIKAHEVFGEMSLLDGHRRSATTRALDDCILLMVPRESLMNLLAEQPRVGYVIMRNLSEILAQRLRDTNLGLRNAIAQQKQMLYGLNRGFR